MAAFNRTFVLVHGAWGGGWIWKDTASILRERGHTVLTPTLTGVGERSHLAGPGVNLSTHIQDIASCLQWDELHGRGVTLVGHSYGGMVISGVCEAVPEGTVDSLVYLDAAVPQDGQSMFAYANRPMENLPAMHPVREGAGAFMTAERQAWFLRMLTPQPMATFTEPVRLAGARDRIRVKTFIKARDGTISLDVAARLKDDPDWRYEVLPCGHDTQLELPEETADALERAALA